MLRKIVFVSVMSLALVPSVLPAQAVASASQQSSTVRRDPAAARVTLKLRNVPLGQAIDAIAKQAGLEVLRQLAGLSLDQRVTISVANATPAAALASVTRGTPVQATVASDGTTIVVRRAVARKASTTQGTATVSGRVTDRDTRQPVAGVRVELVSQAGEEQRYRQTTNEDGRYTIRQIAAGTYAVRVTRLGYTAVDGQVTLGDSATVVRDFAMIRVPTKLEEVITTATGEQRRLEVGNAIATIKADSIVPFAPINNLTDLIAGRVPGVQVMYADGLTGSSAPIRIRGLTSILGSLDPIVILDGIRIEAVPGEDLTGTGSRQRIGKPSRLDDIDPMTIESIDIVRGPSAATLYGTDAAAGVIVIKTKRGQAGPPRWTLTYNLGTITMPKTFAENYRSWGKYLANPQASSCRLLDFAANECTIDSVTFFNPLNHKETSPYRTGLQSTYGAQVSGGYPALRYFLSGSLLDELGTMQMPAADEAVLRAARGGDKLPEWQKHPNVLKRLNLGANMVATLGNTADVTASTSFIQQYHRLAEVPYAGNGTGYNDPETNGWGPSSALPRRSFVSRRTQDVSRMINSLSGNWRPFGWISNRMTLGMDFKNESDDALARPGEIVANHGGSHETQRVTGVMYTGNFGTTMTLSLPFGASSRTSFGAQYNRIRNQQLSAGATGLALGNETITGASSISTPAESQSENAVGGLYMEQVTTLWPGMYLTGPSFRYDAGSAFGKNLQGSLYPKANFSWLPLFGNMIPSLTSLSKSIQLDDIRIRSAFGHSGIQPGPNGGLRTYGAGQGLVNGVVDNLVQIRTIGNRLLKPERSAEFEGGVDATMFNDRLTVEGTYYWKYTKDAIMPQPLEPSLGGFQQAQNIGEIKNTGAEFSFRIQPLQRSILSLDLSAGGSVNHNKLVKLSESGGVDVRGRALKVGYPLNALFSRPIIGYNDINGDGIIVPDEVQIGDTTVYIANGTPETQLNLGTTIGTLNNRFRITALLDYRGRFALRNFNAFQRCANNESCQAINDPTAPLAVQTAWVANRLGSDVGYVERTSFLKFRELSLTFAAPTRVARWAGARTLNLTLNGRNLGTFTKYRGNDPEVTRRDVSYDTEYREDTGGPPPARLWRFNVNIGY